MPLSPRIVLLAALIAVTLVYTVYNRFDLVSSAGPSTVSPTARRSNGLRILHLIDKSTAEAWFTRSHPSFADASDLVQEATLWGKGHEGYDAHFSLRDNLISRFGRADHFDAILPYWNGDQTNHLGLDPAPYFYSIAEVSRSGRGAVVIDRPHEMRDGRRIPMLDLANITLVLAPYPNELAEYNAYASSTLLLHQPHPISPELFYHRANAHRPIDVYFAGSLESNPLSILYGIVSAS